MTISSSSLELRSHVIQYLLRIAALQAESAPPRCTERSSCHKASLTKKCRLIQLEGGRGSSIEPPGSLTEHETYVQLLQQTNMGVFFYGCHFRVISSIENPLLLRSTTAIDV